MKSPFSELESDLPPSLVLGGSHGNKVIFKIPQGIRIEHQIGWFGGLDLLVSTATTGWIVAPGSTVVTDVHPEGIRYTVLHDRPVATLPFVIAEGIMLEQRDQARRAGKPARTAGLTLTACDSRAEWRRSEADRRRRDARAARGLTAAPRASRVDKARRHGWLTETRQGHRHQALHALACSLQRTNNSFEDFERQVQANPVRSKLDGQSPGWLRRQVWDRATTWLAANDRPLKASRPAGSPDAAAWRERVTEPLQEWLAAVDCAIATSGKPEHMKQQLRDIAQAHAYARLHYGSYGQIGDTSGLHYLALSVMGEACGLAGKRTVQKRLAWFYSEGLLRALSRDTLIREQATYYELMIEGAPLLNPQVGGGDESHYRECAARQVGTRSILSCVSPRRVHRHRLPVTPGPARPSTRGPPLTSGSHTRLLSRGRR